MIMSKTRKKTLLPLSNTVTIWIPDKYGIWILLTCPVVKWSGFPMVVWKTDKKLCFLVYNVWYSNHLNWTPEYLTGGVSGIHMSVMWLGWPFEYLTFWTIYRLIFGAYHFKFCNSNVSVNPILGIWIPTVVKTLN